jgi:periplasmic protein TonB
MPDILPDATNTQAASTKETTAEASQVLAPRPDPKYANASPALPPEFAKLGAGTSMILRIFVQTDGSVTDAEIAKSTGDARLDQFAAAYVKAHWRYLPALASGVAIPNWTTVLVPFRS